MAHLCETYGKLPDDPFFTEMDPVLKLWLYEHWLGNQRDQVELAKNHAYLLASFYNPEAVRQVLNDNVHESSDEDMQESMRMVLESDVLPLNNNRPPVKKEEQVRRRRAKLKG